MKKISSKENVIIKKLLKIKRNPEKFAPRLGKLTGEVLLEGPNVVFTAISAGIKIKAILITEKLLQNKKNHHVIDKILKKGISINIMDMSLMKKLSETVNPQGIIAIAKITAFTLQQISSKNILVVSDGIQDPANAGMIIRILDAVGINFFISLKGSVNPYNPKALRASAGSHFHINIVLSDKQEFINWCKKYKIKIIFTSADGQVDIFEWNVKPPLALIFGNEAIGISEQIKNFSDFSVKVPIFGKAESLNVAASAAVILYEIIKKSCCPYFNGQQ